MHLRSLGIRADKADKSRNIAAVMVTAEIGPFAKEGSKWMSQFLQSEMQMPYREVFCFRPLLRSRWKSLFSCSGCCFFGGLSAGGGGGANVQVNHPTVGIVSNGGLVEREIESQVLNNGNEIELILTIS